MVNTMTITNDRDCDLVFYTNPMSRGRIVRWMLEEIGTPYRQVLLEYNKSMKAVDYLAINPMGKVPAITHKGRVVTECAAICAYLADSFPEAGLAPALDDRADYYRWLFFAAGPLESAVIDRNLNVSIRQDQQRMVGYGTYERTIEVLTSAVTNRHYITGSDFSAADVYVGSHVIWGLQFGTIPPNDILEQYAARLMERPAYKAAMNIDVELSESSQN